MCSRSHIYNYGGSASNTLIIKTENINFTNTVAVNVATSIVYNAYIGLYNNITTPTQDVPLETFLRVKIIVLSN